MCGCVLVLCSKTKNHKKAAKKKELLSFLLYAQQGLYPLKVVKKNEHVSLLGCCLVALLRKNKRKRLIQKVLLAVVFLPFKGYKKQ